jgi:osmotically-inducible protein OsmY
MKVAASDTAGLRRELPHDNEWGSTIEDLAKQRLANDCPYSFYFREIDIEFTDGILMLRGRVPSFYLKQVLQTLLTKVNGVSRIENQVDVVSATGLSSVRPRDVKF